MAKIKSKKARAAKILGMLILAYGIVFFLFRGPYSSNSIKRVLIPFLENVTRERVIIDRAAINLFPFYVQAKSFKLFDKDGNRLLWITKSRVYIDLLGLLSKEIRVRKVTILEPKLTANEEDIRRIMENVKKSSSNGKGRKYRMSLKNIKLTDGSFSLTSAKNITAVSDNGLFFSMSSNDRDSANLLIKDLTVKQPDRPDIKGGLKGEITIEDGRFEIADLDVHSGEFNLNLRGELLLSQKGRVKNGSLVGNARIYESVFARIFDLKQEKDGVLSFNGSILLASDNDSKWPTVKFDMRTDSEFYLETLMAIVKVDKNIRGKLALNGEITGTYPDLTGKGTATLENAVLDTLPLEKVAGNIKYKDNKFTLSGFTAHTYDGKLEGTASIAIPDGDYSVNASVADVSSPEFFKFIHWEAPFPKGRINGRFQLNHPHDGDREVTADATYVNTSKTDGNVLERLVSVYTGLELKKGILRLHDTLLSTSHTDLFMGGDIDFNRDMLSLDLEMESRDISDLTSPYYSGFVAPARFKGKAEGPAGAPVISGNLQADSGSIEGMVFAAAFADLTYRTDSLTVHRLQIQNDKAVYDARGSIEFRKAEGLFSFKEPYYRAEASLKNVDVKPLIAASYQEIPVSGLVSGVLTYEGDAGEFTGKGDLVFRDNSVYGHTIDNVIVKAELHPEHIEFLNVTAVNGGSILNAKGKLSFDRKFTLSASSDHILLSDLSAFRNYPFDAEFALDMKGSGTINKPDINFSLYIDESSFKGIDTGSGYVTGRLKDRDLTASGNFADDIVFAHAAATFSDETRWNADLDFKKGRYDFLLSAFLDDVPRDFTASLEGKMKLEGGRDDISMQSRFGALHIGIYGYRFRNKEDIVLELFNDRLSIQSFSLIGNNAELSASGVLKINDTVDLNMKGNLDIEPLKSFSEKVASLKGKGDFVVDITGQWEKPELVGEVNIHDVVLGLSEFPYTIGPLNGAFFLMKDRISFDSLDSDFAGGKVIVSGAGHFEKLSMKRLFISSYFTELKIRPLEGISGVLDGSLFYENSSKGSSLTGNIDIKKAKYEKRVDWKSWILGMKEIKQKTVEYPEFLAGTALNVRIQGDDHIVIDNNLARTPVNIALNVMGTVEQYGLIGRLEADEGKIYFRSNEFNILEGSIVDFVEPNSIAPVFHIIADTYRGDYYIRLSLDGTLDKFTLSLFSEPPLPETEILALLTFGQTSKEAKGIESGIAAGEATAILTGTMQDEVEEQFKNITGFERFEIEPHTTNEGAFSPKVTIGKRLFQDKIIVIYSGALGTTEEQVIRVEYKLKKNLSLVGSRNEVGSAGMDIKYRFEFK